MRYLLAALVVCGMTALAGATEPAKDFDALVKSLSSPVPETRDAAAKELAGRDAAYEPLKALKPDDPEAQKQVQKILTEIEDRCAINPPPISVHFKDLDLEKAMEKVSRAVGIKIAGLKGKETFSLDVDNTPFWQVIDLLSKQHALAYYESICRSHVQEGSGRTLPASEWHGFRTEVKLVRTDSLGAEYSLEAWVRRDPRIAVLGVRSLVVDEVLDEQGRNVTPEAVKEDKYRGTYGLELHHRCKVGPFKPGTKLSSVKAHLEVLVGAGTATLEIPDFLNEMNRNRGEVQIGEQRIALAANLSDSSLLYVGSFRAKSAPPFDRLFDKKMSAYVPVVQVSLFDAGGKQLYPDPGLSYREYTSRWAGDFRVNLQFVRKPVKAILTTAARPLEVKIPLTVPASDLKGPAAAVKPPEAKDVNDVPVTFTATVLVVNPMHSGAWATRTVKVDEPKTKITLRIESVEVSRPKMQRLKSIGVGRDDAGVV